VTMASDQEDYVVRVRNLSKTYRKAKKPVFSNLDFDISHGGRLALLGRNGQGKSTLIRVLGGVAVPTEGSVEWTGTPSWPIGFGGGFQGSLSGYDNVRFLSRIYNTDYQTTLEKVETFAELGPAMGREVKTYSSGMRARLAFGLSLAIEFDCYLIDELISVGDARFRNKCQTELFEKRSNRTFIMASHDMGIIAEHCDQAMILEAGRVRMFNDVAEAIEIYRWLQT